jgi:hypothetical protein
MENSSQSTIYFLYLRDGMYDAADLVGGFYGVESVVVGFGNVDILGISRVEWRRGGRRVCISLITSYIFQ